MEMVIWSIEVAHIIDLTSNWDDQLYNIELLRTIVTISLWRSNERNEDVFSRWFEVNEARLIRPELVHHDINKMKVIQELL